MIRTSIYLFLIVPGAALVAGLSPDFGIDLFSLTGPTDVASYAFGVEMIRGLFIGTSAGGLAVAIAVLLRRLSPASSRKEP
ncbi:MAG: hypothetical protein ACFB21_05375 [Opitutales bacterium]